MKNMISQLNFKRFLTAYFFFMIIASTSLLNAQNVEKKSKIKIKVTTDENGVSKTFEKEYNNEEEMLNDPEYQEFFGKEKNNHFFHLKKGKVPFNIDLDFDFDSLDLGNTSSFSFKHHFDEDGENFFKIDSTNGTSHFKFFFDDDEENSSFSFGSTDSFEQLKEKLEELKNGLDIDIDFFNDSDDSDDSRITKRIIVITKKVKLEELTKEDKELKKIGKKKSKKLELDDFNYYPNPSNGKFSLRFNMENEAPLSIKIFSLSGKEIYGESYDSFSGSFKSEIDLARHDKGIYLLEISQGNKVMNKKLILE